MTARFSLGMQTSDLFDFNASLLLKRLRLNFADSWKIKILTKICCPLFHSKELLQRVTTTNEVIDLVIIKSSKNIVTI